MFLVLGQRWCSAWASSTPKQFELIQDGTLFDGVPGESPRCTVKSATNRQDPWDEHVVTWRCDPNPAHEPEDKPTPKSGYYDLTLRLVPYLSNGEGGHRVILIRDRLPLGRQRVGIYEPCEKEGRR